MKTNKQIIDEAKQSYESHFKDEEYKANPKSEDIMIDKDKMIHDVEKMKLDEEKKHESLEVLREKLEVEAEESLEKIFGK